MERVLALIASLSLAVEADDHLRRELEDTDQALLGELPEALINALLDNSRATTRLIKALESHYSELSA